MLLLHQSGSVKVGEVVRYTLTYTPSNDRILPTPSHLHLKIKNTSAIPLRAAYLHGPYTLHVSAYPATFNPHKKVEDPTREGTPEFEPLLKAGGSWTSKLTVPPNIRETGADLGKRRHSIQSDGSRAEEVGRVTWIIEVASQILFSTSASVGFEVLVGRDERSLDLGFAAVAGHGQGAPGQVKDYYESDPKQQGSRRNKRKSYQSAGVYSKAVRLQVEDTEALWDKPSMPEWEVRDKDGHIKQRKKRKKLHLIIITHGLHSNLGADMLFLKESIDATVASAREERRKKRKESASMANAKSENNNDDPSTPHESSTAPLSGGQEDLDVSDDEEETVVRGFTGNAVRTENGIQYLGKRLAKYILKFTYPDQPFLPIKKNLTKRLTDSFQSSEQRRKSAETEGIPSHQGSSIRNPQDYDAEKLPYRFTSISFIGHSLGGLIQTYAIAYIQKHSPGFFEQIKPVNFICMASPLLGLSNENPMYVKFALDFGLVGRTGQDLGLTWRAPTAMRGGWNAVIGGLGGHKGDQDNQENNDPGAKPLLRILPTGPAHQVLKKFRNRTVYSNVVNDGIVPLRTSCLLFLDWKGLGKVDKARRENGLIGTMAEWGWHELTGTNESERALAKASIMQDRGTGELVSTPDESERDGETVPQPSEDATGEDNRHRTSSMGAMSETGDIYDDNSTAAEQSVPKSLWDGFFGFFRSGTPERTHVSKRTQRAFNRAQTVRAGDDEPSEDDVAGRSGTQTNPTMRPHLPHLPTGQISSKKRPAATRGDSITMDQSGGLLAPPKTSIFESAGDILHPPMPSKKWITDPSTRSRAIFHDRVYHPEDIPPPPVKRPGLLRSRSSVVSETPSGVASKASNLSSSQPGQDSLRPPLVSQNSVRQQQQQQQQPQEGGMKVEEKIARAYHRGLSWRKVLVSLEPDAHNNMIVRRMFANAYGWPVVKHLCDTHFADTYAAMTSDEEESNRERAEAMDKPVGESGERVAGQTSSVDPLHIRSRSEAREAKDALSGLRVAQEGAESIGSGSKISSVVGSSSSSLTVGAPRPSSSASTMFDDSIFDSDAGDSDIDERGFMQRMLGPMPKDPESPTREVRMPERAFHRVEEDQLVGRNNRRSLSGEQSGGMEFHRGLAPRPPTSPKMLSSQKSKRGDAASPIVAKKIVEEPESLSSPTDLERELSGGSAGSAGSTAGVKGLGKGVEQQVSPTKRKTSGSEHVGQYGVGETVARLIGK